MKKLTLILSISFILSCASACQKMKNYPKELVIAPVAQTNDIRVDFELADMIEDVMRQTKFRINISDMTRKTININTIDGLNVCDAKVKQKVLKLQKAFNSHPNIYRNYSIYGIWIKELDGKFVYMSGDSKEVKELFGECKNIYIAIR